MRKLHKVEYGLISKLLSCSNESFLVEEALSDMNVIDLDDGEMGSLEFILEKIDRRFGATILEAIIRDIDGRKVMLELSVDDNGYLYQLDSFTEDFCPLKAELGTNPFVEELHSPPKSIE